MAVPYAVVALLPFREFFPRFSTHLIGNHGDALLQHTHCAWQWLALFEGRFSEILSLPTFFPYRSGLRFGEPLIGVVLPFAPIYALTGSSEAAFNSAVVASFLLVALATFLLARELFHSTSAGLLAAMLVSFTPWQLHFLSALNVLSVHYAVLGLWLLLCWLHRPRLLNLLLAALAFHVQLITAAQGAIAGIYLALVWLAVEWARSGLRLDRRRLVQIATASAAFVALSVPWLFFFEEAFAARSGLLRVPEMAFYSKPVGEMARLFGAFGPLGPLAAIGVPALLWAARRRQLVSGAGTSLLGICAGALVLFVIGRGPFIGPASDPTALPGYIAVRVLPLLDALRASIRVATLTPIALALLASGGLAVLERTLRERFSRRLSRRLPVTLCLAPLVVATFWPKLDPGMAAPIAQRAADLALAEALAELPAASAILSLPMQPGPLGAGVDERVLISRRAQIGGFASVIPPAFLQAALRLGQWPRAGHEIALALGATHLVVPDRWVRGQLGDLEERGYRQRRTVAGGTIFELQGQIPTQPGFQLRVPGAAAAGRWLTLALVQTGWQFHRPGHLRLDARWRASGLEGSEHPVEALALFPGVVGPGAPIRIHVPTPKVPGTYNLFVPFPGRPIDTPIEVGSGATTFDLPIADASIKLAPEYRVPARVRAYTAFHVEVDVTARQGPILLATSRHNLPARRGETVAAYRFWPSGSLRSPRRRPVFGRVLTARTLDADLAPGEQARQIWDLMTPPPGRYDLDVRLVSMGSTDSPMAWTSLILGLEVALD